MGVKMTKFKFLFVIFLLLLSITGTSYAFRIGMYVYKFNGNETQSYFQALADKNFDFAVTNFELYNHHINPSAPSDTFTHFASSNPSKAFLDNANNAGIKLFISCPSMGFGKKDTANGWNKTNWFNAQHAHDSIIYYNSHSALLGWQIVDEPCSQ